VRHGEIETGEAHHPGAFDSGTEIFWVDFKRKVAPVQAERGERGVMHRGRRGMADGKAIDRAKSRGGIDGGLSRFRHAQLIFGHDASSKRKVRFLPGERILPAATTAVMGAGHSANFSHTSAHRDQVDVVHKVKGGAAFSCGRFH